MIRWSTIGLILLLAYAASGLYVVRGNEQALVRRFGRAQPDLAGHGLHWGLPWPATRVDRVNLNEIRTLSIGVPATDVTEVLPLLQPVGASRRGEFLTGDKNILLLQVNVQYRISEPRDFLLSGEAPERHLRLLVERMVADVVARSGVDFVHPLGLHELRRLLSRGTRELAEAHQLGLTVEDVTIGDVRPPVMVKQSFIDVANARAERERLLNEAHAEAERLRAQAQAEAQRIRDRAEIERQQGIADAQGAAGRFLSIIAQFTESAAAGRQTYAQARRMSLEQLYLSLLEDILPQLAGQVFVDGDRPVDLTIQRRGESTPGQ